MSDPNTQAALHVVDLAPDQVVLADAQGNRHTVLAADLLAVAQQGRDAHSLQRHPGALAPRGALQAMTPGADGWTCTFAQGPAITVAAAALIAVLAPPPEPFARQPWRGGLPLPAYASAAVDTDPAVRRAWLGDVLVHGYARLSGVPTAPGTVITVAESFGPVRETNYGRCFDVRVRPRPDNLADSALALPPHTDNPYRDTPPDLQLLHALAVAADGGGATVLVDGLALVDHLRTTAPDALAVLCAVPARFAWRDAAWQLATTAPVVTLGPDGALLRLRVNARSLDRSLAPDPQQRAQWWEAWHHLGACLDDPAFTTTFMLTAGDLVIVDNARVLHGRTAFAAGGGERHLQGAYADIDGLRSQALRLAGSASAVPGPDALRRR